MSRALNVRHLAYMAGRRHVAVGRKPSVKAAKAANPFSLTPAGTKQDLRKGENNRFYAWEAGALDGLVARSKPVKA